MKERKKIERFMTSASVNEHAVFSGKRSRLLSLITQAHALLSSVAGLEDLKPPAQKLLLLAPPSQPDAVSPSVPQIQSRLSGIISAYSSISLSA